MHNLQIIRDLRRWLSSLKPAETYCYRRKKSLFLAPHPTDFLDFGRYFHLAETKRFNRYRTLEWDFLSVTLPLCLLCVRIFFPSCSITGTCLLYFKCKNTLDVRDRRLGTYRKLKCGGFFLLIIVKVLKTLNSKLKYCLKLLTLFCPVHNPNIILAIRYTKQWKLSDYPI